MRYLVFALLSALPLAAVGWVIWQGRHPPAEVALAGPAAGDGGGGGAAARAAPDGDAALLAVFAAPLAATQVKGKVELYDDKGLFDYIDGAAPIYIERHFRRLAAAELATAGGGELTADVYDMRAPENARSIFEAERSDSASPVPDFPDAIAGSMAFVFHSGRYYVKLTAFDAGAEAALPAVGRAIRERLR